MSRRVLWSTDALEDLKAQIAYIAVHNPDAAQRVADRLRSTGEALGEIATGRPGRVAGVYEKSVTGLPYVIAYALGERGGSVILIVLRVIHTARDWPPGGWPR